MNYINNITEAIGNTPLLKLNRVAKDVGANVFVKLEHLNPSGSYKDRMALAMVEAAKRGETWNGKTLPEDGVVVEASAGNTAPALALVCAAQGLRARFVLYRYQFEGATNSRMQITQAFGPEVTVSSDPGDYLTPEQLTELSKDEPDIPHVIAAKMDCQKMEDADPKTVWVDQIYNMANLDGQKAMAREIYEQLDGKIDAIGCSVAAGGTLYGLCSGLEELGVRPEVTFGVVPSGSECYLSLPKNECDYGEYKVSDARHKVAAAMGLNKWVTEESIIHKMVAAGYPDKCFLVSDEDARAMANRLCEEEGIFCGMSSGANVLIALEIAKRLGPGKNVVTTIVDRRDRYLSEAPHEKYVV